MITMKSAITACAPSIAVRSVSPYDGTNSISLVLTVWGGKSCRPARASHQPDTKAVGAGD